MDRMLVVLRHALELRWKGGAWWNRFPWAKQTAGKVKVLRECSRAEQLF